MDNGTFPGKAPGGALNFRGPPDIIAINVSELVVIDFSK